MSFLDRLLEDSARYKRMETRWVKLRGGAIKGDPAQPIIDAVIANGGEADQRLAPVVLKIDQR